MLVKFCNEFKEYWDDFLDVFLHTTWQGKLINFVHRLHLYMSLRHESSLFTPFEGMFGRRGQSFLLTSMEVYRLLLCPLFMMLTLKKQLSV